MKKKKLKGNMFKYAVDIPSAYAKEWLCIDYFETKREAIRFAQTHFGADKYGKVKLISSL